MSIAFSRLEKKHMTTSRKTMWKEEKKEGKQLRIRLVGVGVCVCVFVCFHGQGLS